MAFIALAEFWDAVAASGLVTPDVLAELRRDFAVRGGATKFDTEDVARWLVQIGVLTRWQSRHIARGGRGPYLVGDYRLLDRPSERDGGRRFTAIHEPSGRGVDVVLLDSGLCGDIRVWTEIVRRTGIAHRATHPILSSTWALEQYKSARFLVCEHVEGVTLADELARLGPLPAEAAAGLILAVASAVGELHAAGTVHGGLSLDAVLRQPAPESADERSGAVKLLQFPLVGDPHLVPPSIPLVTAEEQESLGREASFVAPELVGGRVACDPRSDVYALGCMLHALLTGSPPCWRGTPAATLAEAVAVGPPPLGPPAVPRPVAAIVNRMHAWVPAERFSDAAEVAAVLGECLGVGAALPAVEPAVGPASTSTGSMIDPAAAVTRVRDPGQRRPQEVPVAVRMPPAPPRRGSPGFTSLLFGAGGLLVAAFAVLVVRQVGSGTPHRAPHKPDAAHHAAAAANPKSSGPMAGGTSQPVHTPSDRAAPGGGPSARNHAPPEALAITLPQAAPGGSSAPGTTPVPRAAAAPSVALEQVVVDDPRLPWAAPTHGRPPTLAYLLPGSELILRVRLAALVKEPEGGLLLEALGPGVAAAIAAVEAACGCPRESLETVLVGWQSGRSADEAVIGLAVTLVDPDPLVALLKSADARQRAWAATTAVPVGRETIHRGAGRSYWAPAAAGSRVLVIGPEQALTGMIESGSPAPNLPQPLETVVAMLDEDRQVAICGTPHYLLHDGRSLLGGSLAPLVAPLGDFCGDEVKAAAVSLHLGGQCFVELDAVSALDVPAVDLSRRLAERVGRLPDAAEEYAAARQFDAYGRRLVLRLPAMLRVLVANLRHGAEHRAAVLNAYLPQHAAHNVALAAELALAQAAGGAGPTAPAGRPAAPAPQNALGKLRAPMTLTFAKDTLEKSIQMISEEIRVPMDIRGPDLQLEGITKNQSFGLDEREKTAEEILKKILAKADPVGRLIYVVRKQGSEETIEITTRAAAKKRGDAVPPGQDPPAGEAKEKR